MVSTKGRYALRVMIDLAEHDAGKFIPLKEIAERQDISRKYLESIMVLLSKEGLISSLHGKGGGYRLKRPPQDYTAGQILRLAEGTLAPVACLIGNQNPCRHAGECKTLPLWTGLYQQIVEYLDSVTLAQLVDSTLMD